jgi:hypothetical protein
LVLFKDIEVKRWFLKLNEGVIKRKIQESADKVEQSYLIQEKKLWEP